MQARKLPPRQGFTWVTAGFGLFRANPSLISVLAFGYLMVFTFMMVLNQYTGLGALLMPLVQPLLTLTVANGCRIIAGNSKTATPPDLFAGIRERRVDLFKLGGMQLVGSLLVLAVLFALDIKPDPEQPDQLLQMMAIASLLSLPLLLAFWFAPLLTGWDDVPPLKSIFFSVVAVLRNWRAFLVYALTLLAIAMLPAMLAVFALQVSESFGEIVAKMVEVLFVILVVPIFLTGNFVSYRDIFTTNES